MSFFHLLYASQTRSWGGIQNYICKQRAEENISTYEGERQREQAKVGIT